MTKIKIYIKSYYILYLNEFSQKLQNYLIKDLCIHPTQIFLPSKKEKYTLLRSPHADKKARDQFERQTYIRVFIFDLSTLSTKRVQELNYIFQALNVMAVGVEFRIIYVLK